MNLHDAIAFATRAHAGATDKAGHPYIEHPLRVMKNVSMQGEQAMMAAVLHDVLEDTPITAADLLADGCPPEVVSVVQMLTRGKGESYDEFVRRIARSGDHITIAVKGADIAIEKRLSLLSAAEASRLREKYREARAILAQGES